MTPSIAVAHMPEQRQHRREQDALLDADHHNHRSGEQRQPEFTGALAQLVLALPLLLLLGAVSWAQTSPSMNASPTAMASPVAGPSGAMMGQPPMGWPHAYPPWLGSYPRPPRDGVDSGCATGDL
jgi:hypothetical protein